MADSPIDTLVKAFEALIPTICQDLPPTCCDDPDPPTSKAEVPIATPVCTGANRSDIRPRVVHVQMNLARLDQGIVDIKSMRTEIVALRKCLMSLVTRLEQHDRIIVRLDSELCLCSTPPVATSPLNPLKGRRGAISSLPEGCEVFRT